jgi:hypothetical protein
LPSYFASLAIMTVAKKNQPNTPGTASPPALTIKRSEQQQVEERTAIGANVVYEPSHAKAKRLR